MTVIGERRHDYQLGFILEWEKDRVCLVSPADIHLPPRSNPETLLHEPISAAFRAVRPNDGSFTSIDHISVWGLQYFATWGLHGARVSLGLFSGKLTANYADGPVLSFLAPRIPRSPRSSESGAFLEKKMLGCRFMMPVRDDLNNSIYEF